MFTESFKVREVIDEKNLYEKGGLFEQEYKRGHLNLITKTNKPMGTAVMPTGYGKTFQMFGDAITHIKMSDRKIIIIFAAPQLALIAQTQNKFNGILGRMFPNLKDNKGIKFFINSSANGQDYDAESIGSDIHNMDEFEHAFLKNQNAKIALIASCYKSLDIVAKKIERYKKYATVCIYLDEAHKIITESRDSYSEGKKDDQKKNFKLLHNLCKGDYVYAVTATPDGNVTETINRDAYEKYQDKDYKTADWGYRIVNIKGKDAIKENIITPFNLYFDSVSLDAPYKITPKMIMDFYHKVKAHKENNVPTKIMICCVNTPHLEYLNQALSDCGLPIFSTCSKNGQWVIDENGKKTQIVRKEFNDQVNDYPGDCFVLHIEQLAQGIDIQGLTGIIMYQGSVINQGDERKIIQQNGRILRTIEGDRGRSMEERRKKYGETMFVLPDSELSYHIGSQLEDILFEYYGLEGIKDTYNRHVGRGSKIGDRKNLIKSNDSNDEDYSTGDKIYEGKVNERKIIMKEYVERHLSVKYNSPIAKKFKNNSHQSAVMEMVNKFKYYEGEFGMYELLNATDFMDYIEELLAECGI